MKGFFGHYVEFLISASLPILIVALTACQWEQKEHLSLSGIQTLHDLPRISGRPKGIVTDENGNIYVALFRAHAVGKFAASGNLIGWIGHPSNEGWHMIDRPLPGIEPGQLRNPHSLKIRDNILYVTEYGNNRIQRFNLDGVSSGALGIKQNGEFSQGFTDASQLVSSGSHNGLFKGLACLDFDSAGNLYVSDYGSAAIIKFDYNFNYTGWIGQRTDGEYNTHWRQDGSPREGSEILSFRGPHGITISPDNNLYIADTHNHRIKRYTLDGHFIGWLGQASHPAPAGWKLEGRAIKTKKLDGFNGPIDIIFQAGALYVLEVFGNRVQKFNNSGTSSGVFQDNFNQPYHFTLNGQNYLSLSDTVNQRVRQYHLESLDFN